MAADTEGKLDESTLAAAETPSAEGATDIGDDIGAVPDGLERVGVTRARDILGDLALKAAYGKQRIVLTYGRGERDTAALVPMEDLQRLLNGDRSAA